jgi:SpoVK/Ycf46/Vps4 family AAA+-type ATPase
VKARVVITAGGQVSVFVDEGTLEAGQEASINAVRLRIGGQIASKWQGEGERNLGKALAAIEGLRPCLVFIDEGAP